MQKLNCLIIEDEPLAAEIVQCYIEQVPFLKVEAICSDAIAAYEIMSTKKTDVIFLDIHLPRLKGIEFLRTLRYPPKVIITSAYKQYALEGFELEITDYLLKPFSFARFLKAVSRLQVQEVKQVNVSASEKERPFHFFNVNRKKMKVHFDEILLVESLRDYVKIYMLSQHFITKFQLGELETFLGPYGFLRVHRSFIVAKEKIDSVTSDEIEIGSHLIPIGRSYQEAVREKLNLK